MSESVTCDCCGKLGRRPRHHPAPKDWFYVEATDDEDSDPDSTTIIVYVL